jgi:hypothetical protein
MRSLILGRLFNSALFYVAWLVCINQATGHHPYNGPILIGFLLIIHLYLSKQRLLESVLIITVALFGTLFDSIYIHIGWFEYVGGYENFSGIVPLWMTSLWAFYATTINHSLAWAKKSIPLMVVLGALGGPASYAVAFKLGAAVLSVPLITALIGIGIAWSFLFPLTFFYNEWLKSKLIGRA